MKAAPAAKERAMELTVQELAVLLDMTEAEVADAIHKF